MAEQKQNASRALPKNIRQIGTNTGNTRVYLEDYVYTYLHTQEEQEEWAHRGFVLIGRIEREKDYVRYFISGMICLNDHFFKEGILEFNDDTWAYIYQEMKKYYDNLDIVGWGQDAGGVSANMIAEIESSHKKNFNIHKNVLFLLDTVEHEEAFCIFEKNIFQRREGYYVYYEKNPQMQEYMIQMREDRELDIPAHDIKEPLVHSYRETLMDKKEQIAARKWNGVLYTTSMLLVLSVCVLGVSTVNNVEKMQNLESKVSLISGQEGQADASPAMSQNTQQKDSSNSGNNQENSSKMDAEQSLMDENQTGADQNQTKTDDGQTETNETETDDGQTKADETGADGRQTKSDKTGTDSGIKTADENEMANKTGAGDSSDKSKADETGTEKDSDKNNKGIGKDDSKNEKDAGSLETAALSEVQTYLLQGYYIVKKGDSLVSISKKIYGTADNAQNICDLNGIDDINKIYAGQKLELP